MLADRLYHEGTGIFRMRRVSYGRDDIYLQALVQEASPDCEGNIKKGQVLGCFLPGY